MVLKAGLPDPTTLQFYLLNRDFFHFSHDTFYLNFGFIENRCHLCENWETVTVT